MYFQSLTEPLAIFLSEIKKQKLTTQLFIQSPTPKTFTLLINSLQNISPQQINPLLPNSMSSLPYY